MAAVATTGSPPPPRRAEIDELSFARAKRGDRRGSQEFVAFYQRSVFAALSRILGPGRRVNLVEDLAQETFLRALRALPRFDYDGAARISTWLFTIATRVALSELRRRPQADACIDQVPEAAHTTDAAQVEARHALQLALASLTPEQRAVFVLRDAYGLTETEVAQALQLGVEAVKSRLFRARRRLRNVLEEAR